MNNGYTTGQPGIGAPNGGRHMYGVAGGRTSNGRSAEDLLAETLKYQKRISRRTALAAVAHVLLILTLLALLAAAALLLPRIFGIVGQVEDALENVQSLTETAEDAVRDVEETVGEAGTLVKDSGSDLAEAIRKLNSIDIDSLNDAIGSLRDAADALGRIGRQVP